MNSMMHMPLDFFDVWCSFGLRLKRGAGDQSGNDCSCRGLEIEIRFKKHFAKQYEWISFVIHCSSEIQVKILEDGLMQQKPLYSKHTLKLLACVGTWKLCNNLLTSASLLVGSCWVQQWHGGRSWQGQGGYHLVVIIAMLLEIVMLVDVVTRECRFACWHSRTWLWIWFGRDLVRKFGDVY